MPADRILVTHVGSLPRPAPLADLYLRRAQGEAIEWDDGNGLYKVSPLLDWTLSEVHEYIQALKLPYNPLHDRNFPSIGCAPCTRAIEPGQDSRAGRWWWESSERECGLQPRIRIAAAAAR